MKKMLLTAIMCAMLSLGIGGTTSAATPSSSLLVPIAEATVESQELSAFHRMRGGSVLRRDRHGDFRRTDVRRGGYHHYPAPPHRHHYGPHYRR